MQQPVHQEKPVQPAATDRASHPEIAAGPAGRDLRSTLDWLRQQGDLIETEKEVDPDLEVTGLQKHMDGGCPVLFNNVKGKPGHRVITNLFGDMNVINKMFGWKDDVERTHRIAAAFRKPLKPVIISQSEAPVQEHVVLDPKDVNEFMVPIRHTSLREGADRRLRHPLHQLRPVRWRHRPRLQPHEFPLGQCRHVPDFARLPHVAGGE